MIKIEKRRSISNLFEIWDVIPTITSALLAILDCAVMAMLIMLELGVGIKATSIIVGIAGCGRWPATGLLSWTLEEVAIGSVSTNSGS